MTEGLRRVGVEMGELTDPEGAASELEERPVDFAVAVLEPESALGLLASVGFAHPDVPVVVVAGSGYGAEVAALLRAGAADFLALPVDEEELAAVLERVAARRRALDLVAKYPRRMWAWAAALVGAIAGAAVGLFGPVLLFRVLAIGSGSYEDVLFIWFLAVPAGLVLGAWLGYRLAKRLAERRGGAD